MSSCHRKQVLSSGASRSSDIGQGGEALVGEWLESQGWEILHRRWHCRWGELDLIARSPWGLAFVEVKTRGIGNWDADGLLAITARKQQKLWQAAELFVSTYAEFADLPCRFDVALVSHCRVRGTLPPSDRLDAPGTIAVGKPIAIGDRSWTLQVYLESAFDGL